MTMTYFTSDGQDPNKLRPMTKEESIQMYHELVDEAPDMLADLYIDFYDFDVIEFLIFKDRLSAAVLIANSAKKALDDWASKFEAMREDRSYIVPGWETESRHVLDEKVGITHDAYQISIGATILTAVAALEGLLIDLVGDKKPKTEGLFNLMQAFLRIHDVPEPEARSIIQLLRKVSKRRNTFAHSLTGSYWETDQSIKDMFTPEAMEDTLYAVGEIGVQLQEIMNVPNEDSGNSE
jgi:hypothetical protein